MSTGNDASGVDEFAALLDGVYARRRAELLERAEALVAAVDLWAAGAVEGAEAAADEAHRLAGGLGTLGFDALSADARRLEVRAAEPGPVGEAEQALAAGLLQALLDADRRPS